jgi:hypothetical protein
MLATLSADGGKVPGPEMTFLVRGTKRVLGVVSDHGWKKTSAGAETLELYHLSSAAVG